MSNPAVILSLSKDLRRLPVFLTFTILLFCYTDVSAQNRTSPYLLNTQRDLPILFSGVTLFVLAPTIEFHKPTLAPVSYSSQSVWKPERWVTKLDNSRASKASDILLYTSQVTPALLLISKDTRSDWRVYAMGAEAIGLTAALTSFTKAITDRKRPYVYNPNTPASDITSDNAVQSFFSGHTAMASVSTFYFARVFADYHPDSKWKPWVWTMATALPLATATMRVVAGRHFPTDVLVGYVVGAGIGYLVPTLHKWPKRKQATLTAL